MAEENQRRPDQPDPFAEARHEMVEMQIRRRNIRDDRVLACLEHVPRHEFMSADFASRAYDDIPLPIGGGQTISQPYIVAAMTSALRLAGNERVLEIGTGLGYQAAVLGCLAREVFSVEVRPELARLAGDRLARLGYTNVHVHHGDGTLGLPEFAPYDAVLVAAAAPSIPQPLLAQLAEGGRMVIPVGDVENQELRLIERDRDTFHTTALEGCRFVPLLGAHGWKDAPQR
jgi:protein-L-isoaspartate(D-aspartate) O-methyltransferase